jgi:hypothetical protein
MQKNSGRITKEQFDLFKRSDDTRSNIESPDRPTAKIYFIDKDISGNIQRENTSEKKALEIVKSLSRHLSIWD